MSLSLNLSCSSGQSAVVVEKVIFVYVSRLRQVNRVIHASLHGFFITQAVCCSFCKVTADISTEMRVLSTSTAVCYHFQCSYLALVSGLLDVISDRCTFARMVVYRQESFQTPLVICGYVE